MRDEVVAAFAPVPAGVVVDATRRRRWPQRGAAAQSRRPQRARHRPRRGRRPGGDDPAGRVRRALPCRSRPVRRAVPPGTVRGERCAVRPRCVLTAAGPGRARVLLPQPRTARHADGHERAMVGRRRRQRLRRRRARPRAARLRRRAVRHTDRQGDRGGPTHRVDDRPGGHRHSGDPCGCPPHRRPPGQANVPGHPGRGQRRARDAADGDRRGDRRNRRRRPSGRALVPLGRGPHRQGSVPSCHRRLRLPSWTALRVRRRADRASGPGSAPTIRRPNSRPTPALLRRGSASPSEWSPTRRQADGSTHPRPPPADRTDEGASAGTNDGSRDASQPPPDPPTDTSVSSPARGLPSTPQSCSLGWSSH